MFGILEQLVLVAWYDLQGTISISLHVNLCMKNCTMAFCFCFLLDASTKSVASLGVS